MERAILKVDPLHFTVCEKSHCVLVHERDVPQVKRQLLPGRLDDEQLLDLIEILRLHPATESEDYLTVRCSLNSEHKLKSLLGRQFDAQK